MEFACKQSAIKKNKTPLNSKVKQKQVVLKNEKCILTIALKKILQIIILLSLCIKLRYSLKSLATDLHWYKIYHWCKSGVFGMKLNEKKEIKKVKLQKFSSKEIICSQFYKPAT